MSDRHRMTEDEIRAFLTSVPAHTGKVATVRKDGRPHVAPIWYDVDDDGTIVFTTFRDSLKGKTIRRDPRVAMAVDDERPPFSFVTVEGTVTISEDLDDLLAWATRIGGRYMGADQAEAYGRRNAVEGELLVRLTPVHLVGMKDIAD